MTDLSALTQYAGLRFLSRLLGLLLAVIAVQFILQGVEETVSGRVSGMSQPFSPFPLVLCPFQII
jgi:hypothetical protein